VRRPQLSLLWRLAIGLAAVSALAVMVATAFLYIRFGAIDSGFREGTLHSFANLLAKDLARADGSPAASIRQSTRQRIADAGGSFAIVSLSGDLVAGSAGVLAALIPPEDLGARLFTLPKGANGEPIYGLSIRVPGRSPPILAQVAFPANPVLFDSVLEEFLQDIAWIWLPFIFCLLALNIVVARFALKPLKKAAHQAETIGPASIAVRLSEERLPRDVLALVRAVNFALDRLQLGYRAMEDFVADVAHELRTPLAIVKAQLALSDAPVARSLEGDFAKMERLVQQLLDRVRLGGVHFEPDDQVDLSDVASDAAKFLAPLIVSRHRSIELIGADEPIYVIGARDYLFRALRNLIENALEFTPPHSVVTVVLDNDPSIAVLDRGPGFAPAKLNLKLNGPRVMGSERSDGVGLGLWIAERTMVAHGGRLDLANRQGGGAVVTMNFASVARPAPRTSEARATEPPQFQH
jgi:signal transduction histidine kinase